ncbi:OsmC family protein [Bacillus methanolicus PB1]|uniref:OsmC family protein n=1 Tax=Bacillus methanolicus PB1 TaxID=997296 RepID=I3DW62_BACMT|nr:OsmC family protein [Bacillus methanolicus]EIJ78483.1 OsmC family protein [Bacillus methanolicus PB1]
MSTLKEYLVQKREAGLKLQEHYEKHPESAVEPIKARVKAKGRSGVREIRIRDFQIISDSPENFAGYSLGPTSPEIQLGVLGSCLTHITLIQASLLQISIDSLEVEITGIQNHLAGKEGFEDVPIYPHNIRYKLFIQSEESPETIAKLHEEVEKVCPILNLLKNPQQIEGEVIHTNQSSEKIRA